jgi:hypothetical protein
MKSLSALLAISVFLLAAGCRSSASARKMARDLSRRAISALENRPFDGDSVGLAGRDVGIARGLAPDEALVHVAAGKLALTTGHDVGSWYKLSRYAPQAVETARREASAALQADPKSPEAWCFQAYIDILERRWDRVQDEVNRAWQLDSSAFEPYQLRAVSMRLLKRYDESRHFYMVADSHAVEMWQRKQVLAGLGEVARGVGDTDGQLALLHRLVELEPGNAWTTGLVAEWHMSHHRYAEAVIWWEKAVALAPFPRAVQQLAKAREAVRTGVAPAADD